MKVQVDGKALADFSPTASKYLESAEALQSMAIVALVDGVAKEFEKEISDLKRALLANDAELAAAQKECARLTEQYESVQSRLSRPRNGGNMQKQKLSPRGEHYEAHDVDDTTHALMKEAYNGKDPKTKRRVEV
jgi:hypothetical protein